MSQASIADIIRDAGDQASQLYSRTPLDFISRKEYPWSLYWSNWINILRNLHINFAPRHRPAARFENTTCLEIPADMQWISLGLTAIYAAVFLGGWNYSFPTRTEQNLWRAASVTLMSTLVLYWAITEFTFTLYPKLRPRLSAVLARARNVGGKPATRAWHGHSNKMGSLGRRATSIAECIRNNSVGQDPALTVPLKAMLPIYVVGFFYCNARTYIFIADIIELRSLPASAYQTVNWTDFIPHI